MRTGIFGKLPTKRDFVAIGLRPDFLRVWEDWMQASVAASRQQLGGRWTELFLAAPIWRFWLGREICGGTVTGAFMPSVDGVGRYFPLCICGCAEPGEDISPPGAKPMHRWFDKAETALLRALETGFAAEPTALLEGLDLDLAVRGDDPGEIEVTRLLSEGLQAALSRDSWWWSIGGGGFPVQMRRLQGLPDAYQFADFMTPGDERQSRMSA